MTDSNKSAAQFLEELRKERDELDGLIQALEKRLGSSPSQHIGESDDEEQRPRVGVATTNIPIGFFHNLSQAAAAEKLLKMNPGHALTTADILDAFRGGGMEVNSKNAPTILYTALKRSPKFERVGSKAWGLREWYPERKKKSAREDKESSGVEGA